MGGGRPRRITTADEDFTVAAATARPEALGLAFTRRSLRNLAGYLGDNDDGPVSISPERLRQILRRHDITFQGTKTWKEPNDPDRDAKLDRIDEALERHPERCFAFDEFGPGRCPCAPSVAPRGRLRVVPNASRRTITSSTACGSSTAATRSATTRCGAWCVAASRRRTPSQR